MRNQLAVIGAIVCALGAVVTLDRAVDAATALSTAPKAGATVKVDMTSSEGTGHGSGVHLGNGVVLTAGHVADPEAALTVKTDKGGEFKASVLWRNEDYDIALIKAPIKDTESASLACVTPYVGQEVHAAGNPGPFEYVVTYGRVAGKELFDIKPWKVLQPIDVTGGPGISGGPVYNTINQVVGVWVAGPQIQRFARAWFGLMVPASAVCDLMGRNAT